MDSFFKLLPHKTILKNTNQKNYRIFTFNGYCPVNTGLGPYYLGWEEPLRSLYGNIIWFIKPINEVKGLSGLFNNPNYAGSWLSVIWPFSLAFCLKKKNSNLKRLLIVYIFF